MLHEAFWDPTENFLYPFSFICAVPPNYSASEDLLEKCSHFDSFLIPIKKELRGVTIPTRKELKAIRRNAGKENHVPKAFFFSGPHEDSPHFTVIVIVGEASDHLSEDLTRYFISKFPVSAFHSRNLQEIMEHSRNFLEKSVRKKTDTKHYMVGAIFII